MYAMGCISICIKIWSHVNVLERRMRAIVTPKIIQPLFKAMGATKRYPFLSVDTKRTPLVFNSYPGSIMNNSMVGVLKANIRVCRKAKLSAKTVYVVEMFFRPVFLSALESFSLFHYPLII